MANQWYVVHVYSGHEYKVKKGLEMTVANLNMQDTISQILVPTEEVIEVKQNKKKIKKRKFYPGYIFVEMTINNSTYWLIRNTAGVTGFLGGVKPIPISQFEVENILNTVANPDTSKPRPAVSFEKEENIRIIEGPFKHFIGIVEEVNHERGKLRVMVTIFGRHTPVELGFLQVEKM
ncbi:transcription termination/antitermination protein NusG [Endomicrobiia bacterium]|uniref:Transcription termination/antitermination protein NusG n=1 Tax=Endomicrobium trichonymphae TaxID=1408204 RepID=B1GZN1_ENDTX|nr:transcription termination/antitermination protein NusG [Candidatus Endomicrobium trichonymphae]GHT07279.1 transcription termination/antitermination protein NusG [Endomicrobiia bacterium]BAG13713.1 transcription antitermination factor NusG [Candidatus Endomicrobium trichonymphae]BAV58784.1 transcription antitermination factor NusG [Candidatus Endomicrobium trichonymphae]GHT12686.1 transcription termination/antitermination protein NusG [Endomicrobiia bacterium]GHT21067.1 transcription termina